MNEKRRIIIPLIKFGVEFSEGQVQIDIDHPALPKVGAFLSENQFDESIAWTFYSHTDDDFDVELLVVLRKEMLKAIEHAMTIIELGKVKPEGKHIKTMVYCPKEEVLEITFEEGNEIRIPVAKEKASSLLTGRLFYVDQYEEILKAVSAS